MLLFTTSPPSWLKPRTPRVDSYSQVCKCNVVSAGGLSSRGGTPERPPWQPECLWFRGNLFFALRTSALLGSLFFFWVPRANLNSHCGFQQQHLLGGNGISSGCFGVRGMCGLFSLLCL